MSFTYLYDTIIIGSGISGLYYCYKNHHNLGKFTILEKNNYIGGRIKTDEFYGHTLSCGAGVGRFNKDKLLKQLLQELDIPIEKKISKYYNQDKTFVLNILQNIKLYIEENNVTNISFKKVLYTLYDSKTCIKFIHEMGISDYLNEDVRETIYHYGMKDNINKINIFYVPWKLLIDKLVKTIKEKTKSNSNTFLLNYKVLDVYEQLVEYNNNDINKLIKIHTNNNDINKLIKIHTNKKDFICKKIIFATDINLIHKISLFKLNKLYKFYSFISCQTFCRIYIKFDNNTNIELKNYIPDGVLVTLNEFQKIIPISKEDGIYMIAYSDNFYANKVDKYNISELSTIIKKYFKLDFNVNIIGMKKYFWKCGTHYFKPYPWELQIWKKIIKQLQNPLENVFVIGELLSFNQGWVEGGLESVESIL